MKSILLTIPFVFLSFFNGSAQDVYSFQSEKEYKYKGEVYRDLYVDGNFRYIISKTKGSNENYIEKFNSETAQMLNSNVLNLGKMSYTFPYYFFSKDLLEIYYTELSENEEGMDIVYAQYNKSSLEFVQKKVVHTFYNLEKKTFPYVKATSGDKVFIGADTKLKKKKSEETVLLIAGEKVAEYDLKELTALKTNKIYESQYFSLAEFLDDGTLVIMINNPSSMVYSIDGPNTSYVQATSDNYKELNFSKNKWRLSDLEDNNINEKLIANVFFERKKTANIGTPEFDKITANDKITISELDFLNNDTSKILEVNLSPLYKKLEREKSNDRSLFTGELQVLDVHEYKNAYYVHLLSYKISRGSSGGTSTVSQVKYENHFLKIENSKIVGSKHIKSVDRSASFENGKFTFAVVALVTKMGMDFKKQNSLPSGHSIVSSQVIDLTTCNTSEYQDLDFILIEGKFNLSLDGENWTSNPREMQFRINDSNSIKVGKYKYSHKAGAEK